MAIRPGEAVGRPGPTVRRTPAPAPAHRGRPNLASPRVISPIGWLADGLTLVAAVLLPNAGLAIGGRLGIGYGDIIFGLACAVRGVHLIVGGLPIVRLRRWSFLLGVVSILLGAGFISGIVNGNPITSIYLFMVFALFGAVIMVGTFGGDDHEQNMRRLASAFAAGCCLLSVSSFLGPSAQGRNIGWAIHPNALGHSLIMGLAVTVWLLDRSTTFRSRLIWTGGVFLCVAGVMSSGSRGSTIAIGVFGLSYLVLRGNFRVVLATLAVAWVAVLVLLVGAVDLGIGNPIQRLFGNDLTSQYSDAERAQLLEENLEDIGQDPLFGKGWDTITNIHVVYFQAWVGGGALPALTVMLLGVTMVLMPLWQPRRELALACGAAGLAVAWLVTNIFTARDQWIFLALVFGQSHSPLALGPQIRSALR